MSNRENEVERTDVAFRLLYSLIFAIVVSVLETLVGALVIFQLAYSLIAGKEPPQRTRDLGNTLAVYHYRIMRYLMHDDFERPFPFADLPEPIEPPRPAYPPGASHEDRDPS